MTAIPSFLLGPQAMAMQASLTAQSPSQDPDGLAFPFADILASRALLDAPASATRVGLEAGERAASQELAPVALRFDEAPLLGRAFEAARAAWPTAETACVGAIPVGEDAPVGSDAHEAVEGLPNAPSSRGGAVSHRSHAADGEGFEVAPSQAWSTVDGDVAFAAAAPTDDGRARPMSWRGVDATFGREAIVSPPPHRVPADISNVMVAMRGQPGRSMSEPTPVENSNREVAREKVREARAQFLDHLGPVHLVVREQGAALMVAARVARLGPDEEDALERRLRNAVLDDGRALAALTVNGHARPLVGEA